MLYYKKSIPYYVGSREILAAFFIVIGYAYKQSKLKFEDHPCICILTGLVLVSVGTKYWQCGMLILTWQKVIPYSVSAIAGTLMVFSLCKSLSKVSFIERPLTYIGDRTLDVLTWHFLSFKVISVLIIVIYALPIKRLAEFPVIDEYAYQGWWMLYLMTGMVFSLAVEFILSKAKKL